MPLRKRFRNGCAVYGCSSDDAAFNRILIVFSSSYSFVWHVCLFERLFLYVVSQLNDLFKYADYTTLLVPEHIDTIVYLQSLLLYKPWALSMGEGNFRPPQLRDPSTDFHET